MARKKRKIAESSQNQGDFVDIENDSHEPEAIVDETPAVVEAGGYDRALYRVRCVDPTLRGYSVRGVIVPMGGEVTLDLSRPAYALSEVLGDPRVIAEPVQ